MNHSCAVEILFSASQVGKIVSFKINRTDDYVGKIAIDNEDTLSSILVFLQIH
jgi:predicted RNA binding protein with dsRBD fold (UPF0201 family)